MTTPPSQKARYLIEEKYLSLENRFTITDQSGNICYKCNSIFFVLGGKLSLYDGNGKEIIRIRQENLHLHQTYKLFLVRSDDSEREIASIRKTGTPWHNQLEISSANGEYVLQRSSESSLKFKLTKDNRIVATIVKDSSPTKSFYWVDIIEELEGDHVFVLAAVIVLAYA